MPAVSAVPVVFFPVIVTAAPPSDDDVYPYDPARLRLARAGEILDEDLVVGDVSDQAGRLAVTDYVANPYPAAPAGVDPAHCSHCREAATPAVRLTHDAAPGNPWDGACDVKPRTDVVLHVPAARLPEPARPATTTQGRPVPAAAGRDFPVLRNLLRF